MVPSMSASVVLLLRALEEKGESWNQRDEGNNSSFALYSCQIQCP